MNIYTEIKYLLKLLDDWIVNNMPALNWTILGMIIFTLVIIVLVIAKFKDKL